MNLKTVFNRFLWAEKPAFSIAIFRICFGAIMALEFLRLIFTDLSNFRYLNTVFHFKYPFFEWVKQAPDALMLIVFWIGFISAILFSVGFLFRLAAPLVFALYTYLFLLDISYWNNHFFLFVLLLGVMLFGEANKTWSVDARLFRYEEALVPAWNINLVKVLFGISLLFGAFSKFLNSDWFTHVTTTHILTNSFNRNNWTDYDYVLELLIPVFTYGGFWFDLLILPILLFKRTFWVGAALMLGFNIINFLVLEIGTFPFLMISALILFYPEKEKYNKLVLVRSKIKSTIIFLLIGIVTCLPFRHLFVEGNVLWTGEGKIGAWHMMSGSTDVSVKNFILKEKNRNGEVFNIDVVDPSMFLNRKQLRTLGKWPALAPQFARFLKIEAELAGFKNVSVHGNVQVLRNGRTGKPILDSRIDLATAKYCAFRHNAYVLLYIDEE